MNAATVALRQIRYENKAFWRNPAAVGFTFAFPIMFLIIFNVLKLGPPSEFYVPSIAAFSVISACYTNIAMSVVFLRDEGVLRRLRGAPMPAWTFLLARTVHAAFVALLLVIVITIVGMLFFDVDAPANVGKIAVAVLVGAATFAALGLAFTAIVPNPDAGPPMVNLSILPMLFISDVFLPADRASDWIQTFADVFPIKHFAELMHGAYEVLPGAEWESNDLLVVAIWGVAGLLLAVRFFSWEPRR